MRWKANTPRREDREGRLVRGLGRWGLDYFRRIRRLPRLLPRIIFRFIMSVVSFAESAKSVTQQY